jgi:NAD-dependent deacetylase
MLAPPILARFRGRVLVLTGAGISVASGLPTFRGDGGLYEGLNPYELATPEAFAKDPVLVWNWYAMRIHQGKHAQPNAAHVALVALESAAAEFTLITSNVDRLHERARNKRVFKLHGDILRTRCSACGKKDELIDPLPEFFEVDTLLRCACGGLLRPDVVWFGEYPNPEAILAVRRGLPEAHVVLEVGSSGVVSYGLAEVAVQMGIPVVRVNPDAVEERGVIAAAQPAEVALPELVSLLKQALTD